jgi:enoyl-CoA hydratase/carnithine racemase
MPYATLDCVTDGGILTVTLTRPEHLNAFTVEMADELVDVFTRVNDDDDVRAVVLTGSGRAFCAGMDLSVGGNVFGLDESLTPTWADLQDRLDDEAILRGVRDTGGRVVLAIFECRKPVIAAINGAAVGIGATMTLAADLRLASTKARIGFVFGRLGITPEACSTWFLPRLVGIPQALEWLYSAEILTAEDAHAGGLVQRVVAPEELLGAAQALAAKFVAGRSPVAVAMTRQMVYRNVGATHPLAAHQVDSLSMFYTSIGDGKEGVRAFLAKEDPAFRGRASAMPSFYDDWLGAAGREGS